MSTELKSISDGIAALARSAERTVVQVDARRRFPASGIVWSEEGLIVTANHVVRKDNIHVGLSDGSSLEATLLGRDPGIDIAVLKVEAEGLSAIDWTPEDEMNVGEIVLALGRPGQILQASLGILSAMGGAWHVPGGGLASHYIRPDLVMYPGFSGGPILGTDGRIIGMATSAFGREGAVALSRSTVAPLAADLVKHGSIRRNYLGVGVQAVLLPTVTVAQVGQETGVLLNSVKSDSPAERGGLVVGDILISLDDESLRDPRDLAVALRANRADKQVRLQVIRGGEQLEMLVDLGASGE